MRNLKGLAVAFFLSAATGCAVGFNSPATGFLLTDTKYSGTNNLERGSKTGQSECTSILGLVGNGDCRVSTAAQNGGIKNIKSVEYHSWSILGIYGRYTTVVSGE